MVIIRQARPADQEKISNLVYFERHVHRHLDWRSPLDWLGAPEYWVREEDGQITAALACPPDPENALWLRLFVHTSHLSLQEGWSSLWQTARQNIHAGQAAAIVLSPWMEEVLHLSGFSLQDEVITLEHPAPFPAQPGLPPGMQARPMARADLPAVTQVDAAAFSPLWRNSLPTLQTAFQLAALAEVLLVEDQIIAYQISTRSPSGTHLARLAVSPSAQRRGAGSALVGRLLAWAGQTGLSRVSVNTQGSNQFSLALYQKMGFQRTGEDYPVYVYPFHTS